MKFLLPAVYVACLLGTFILCGVEAQGTISPTNITIDEAPFATTLEQLLANITILSNTDIAADCYPEVTVAFTCSFTDASNITAVQLWFNDGGPYGFQRNFLFFGNVISSSADNYTIDFQRILQLRQVGGFAELAGDYKCLANTGAETPNATVEVLYRPIFIPGFDDSQGDIILFDFFSLTTVFAVEGTSDNVSLPITFTGANPPPFGFDWMYNDQPLISLDGSGVGTGGDDGRLIGTGGGLQVLHPYRSDSGVYQVTASNPAGTGSLNTLLVVRYPPEFESLQRVIYVRAGDPLQLNCTPDAHSSSRENVPSFDLEDSRGPTQITQLSYSLSKNGTEMITADAGSSGLLTVTDAASMADSGMYSCVVQEDVFQKTAIITQLARRKRRGVVRLPLVTFLDMVRVDRVSDTSLSTAVNFSVIVGNIPEAPRALIVAVVSPDSVVVSWLPSQTLQTDTPVPAFHEVTITDLETGQVLRRNSVSSGGTGGVSQQRQDYDRLVPGSYRVTVRAANVFGPSRSLSQNFDIAASKCFYFYALIASAVVLLVALLLVSVLAVCLMYVIKQARAATPLEGESDLPVVLKSQHMKDRSVQEHLSDRVSGGTFEGYIKSTSFYGPGDEEGEVNGEGFPLETNPAYQSGAQAIARNEDTHQSASGSASAVQGTSSPTGVGNGVQGASESGTTLTAVHESPLCNVGTPPPNVGAPPPNVGAPSPNVGTPQGPPNVVTPPPNVGVPPLNVGAHPLNDGTSPLNVGASPTPSNDGTPPTSDEADLRVSGIYESTVDANDIYDVVV